MDWKAFGFRISKLGEKVNITQRPSAAIIRPNAVLGFNSQGNYIFYDLASAQCILNDQGEWTWYAQNHGPITDERLRKYLIDLGFQEEWLDGNYAEFNFDAYEPAYLFSGEKMHYGFRVATEVCNALAITSAGAVETADSSGTTANKPWWREAFFGYTLPAQATFSFIISNTSATLEDLGTWQHVNGDDIECWEHYPGLLPPRKDEPGKDTLQGDRLRIFGSGAFYYPANAGWDEETIIRTLVGSDGKTYAYGWMSQDINDFVWCEIKDLTLRFTFPSVHESEPEIKVTSSGFKVANLRSRRTFTIRTDVEAIAEANQWTPTSDQYDVIYNAALAAIRISSLSQDFYPIAVYGELIQIGRTLTGRNSIVLPSTDAVAAGRWYGAGGDNWDAIYATADDVTAATVANTDIEVSPPAAAIHHKLTIAAATCEWMRTDKHEIQFEESGAGADYMHLYAKFNGTDLPFDGTLGAEAFVEAYGKGANPSEPGSFTGPIEITSTWLEDYDLGYDETGTEVSNTTDRSWAVRLAKK